MDGEGARETNVMEFLPFGDSPRADTPRASANEGAESRITRSSAEIVPAARSAGTRACATNERRFGDHFRHTRRTCPSVQPAARPAALRPGMCDAPIGWKGTPMERFESTQSSHLEDEGFREILVPTDFSEASERAMSMAV